MSCIEASKLQTPLKPSKAVLQLSAGSHALLSCQYTRIICYRPGSPRSNRWAALFAPTHLFASQILYNSLGLAGCCSTRISRPEGTLCAANASSGLASEDLHQHVSELGSLDRTHHVVSTPPAVLESGDCKEPSLVPVSELPTNKPQLHNGGSPRTHWHTLRSFSLFAFAGIVIAVTLGLQLPKRRGWHPQLVQTSTFASLSLTGLSKVEQEEPPAIVPVALTPRNETTIATDVPALGGPSALTQPRRRSLGAGAENPVVLGAASSPEAPVIKIDEKDLKEWMHGLKEEARKRGVGEKVIKRALIGARPVPKVIEKDRNQPEFKLTFEDYMERMVTDYRIKLGVAMMEKHGPLLKEVSAKYGVPEATIVAIWGMESSYGNFMGTWDVVAALVTLAYDKEQPARAKYFREELINSLLILQDGHIGFDTMRGSWAGAMGQCQFMPSSFRNYAVDFDGDGKADIWTSTADVLGSIANYLQKHGWKAGEPYFEKVTVSGKIKPELLGLKVQKPAGEWRETHGVTPLTEPPVLPPQCSASLVALDDAFYLASHNVSVVLRYNKSLFYAMAVGHIADSIESSLST